MQSAFDRRKEAILAALATPDADYTDASPKGSVDVGIRDLIDEINALPGFVTTSSCAGRVSVFVEGRKAVSAASDRSDEAAAAALAAAAAEGSAVGRDDGAREEGDGRSQAKLAGVGGKGGGGAWLYVSHDPVLVPAEGWGRGELEGLLGLGAAEHDQLDDGARSSATGTVRSDARDRRLIHFKFEPMILHVLTASLEHAQLLLRCGSQAGFRESGAVNLLPAAGHPGGDPAAATTTPMVAIRSMGLAFESLVGQQETPEWRRQTVPSEYLETLVDIANERFVENGKRIARFRAAVLEATQNNPVAAAGAATKRQLRRQDGEEWEDAQARRERKRAEGLRRKAELDQRSGGTTEGSKDAGAFDASSVLDVSLDLESAA